MSHLFHLNNAILNFFCFIRFESSVLLSQSNSSAGNLSVCFTGGQSGAGIWRSGMFVSKIYKNLPFVESITCHFTSRIFFRKKSFQEFFVFSSEGRIVGRFCFYFICLEVNYNCFSNLRSRLFFRKLSEQIVEFRSKDNLAITWIFLNLALPTSFFWNNWPWFICFDLLITFCFNSLKNAISSEFNDEINLKIS